MEENKLTSKTKLDNAIKEAMNVFETETGCCIDRIRVTKEIKDIDRFGYIDYGNIVTTNIELEVS